MKFLEYAGIDAINSALVFETPECKVYGRVEPYSCKSLSLLVLFQLMKVVVLPDGW